MNQTEYAALLTDHFLARFEKAVANLPDYALRNAQDYLVGSAFDPINVGIAIDTDHPDFSQQELNTLFEQIKALVTRENILATIPAGELIDALKRSDTYVFAKLARAAGLVKPTWIKEIPRRVSKFAKPYEW
jgi:hypothetical protein